MELSSLLNNDRRWLALTPGILALGVLWSILTRAPAAATSNGAPPPSPRQGFSAPDFTLETLDGGQITLSDLRGQVVLINFWATWCPPCRAEMPALERVYRSFKPMGLEVLAVNLTDQDDEVAVSRFIQELGLTFPILLDRRGEASKRYLLRGLPSTFFVDRQGVIRSVVVGGPMSEALIQSKVEELIKESR